MSEPIPDVSLTEDHGDDDGPELDEALDANFETEFEVAFDPATEQRDIHEVDEELGR